jgi:hypothetical protein
MHHVRDAYNPSDFRVSAAAINPWMDPAVSHPYGVRFVLETATRLDGPPPGCVDRKLRLACWKSCSRVEGNHASNLGGSARCGRSRR